MEPIACVQTITKLWLVTGVNQSLISSARRLASHADVLTGSSRNHSSPTRDEPLRTFAWEATRRLKETSPVNKEGLNVVSSDRLYQMDVTSLLLQGIKKKSFITHREVSPGPNTQK